MTFNCVPSCFYFALGSSSAGKCAQTYEKLSFSSIFRRLGSFPQDFGQAKEWLILKWHEMKTVLM